MYTADEYFNTPKKSRPTGVLVYDGPSMLSGGPIVGILTFGSGNVKTGDLAQLWILCREVKPAEAHRTGQDVDVCGDCIHRLKDTCYVTLIHGPRAVHDAFKRNRYPVCSPAEAGKIVAGRPVRLGAYGEPAALPADVVRAVVSLASRHTGYTHQWEAGRPSLPGLTRGSGPELKDVCMASVDSSAGVQSARLAGFRYFRVLPVGVKELTDSEISCPASAEAGKVTTCDRCGLCSGARQDRTDNRKNITIQAHGAGASKV